MDTDAFYATFTHPKVVTSMLFMGIALGLVLCILMRMFWGAWFLPAALAAIILGTVIVYMAWLDRQEFREPEGVPLEEFTPVKAPVLIPAECLPLPVSSPSRYAVFTDLRVIRSMLVLAIGLGLSLCIVIVLFRGTWYLPALIAGITMAAVVTFLCWLDDLKPDNRRGPPETL